MVELSQVEVSMCRRCQSSNTNVGPNIKKIGNWKFDIF